MRIQPYKPIESNYIKANAPAQFQKNQIIKGYILSIEGNKLDILFAGGVQIKASLEGNLNLPVNSYIDFHIIEITEDLMVIKPVDIEEMTSASRERMLKGLASALNLKPARQNIKFLERCSNLTVSSLGRLWETSMTDGKTDVFSILKQIVVEPEKLREYLKGFEKGDGEKLTAQLKMLFEAVTNESKNSSIYTKLLGDTAKSLLVQTNHPFPLFYIPVPLIFGNTLYPSEIWIEKDQSEDQKNKKNISIHLLMDTPHLGRIEGCIVCFDSQLGIDLYCSRENLHLFKESLQKLNERLSSLGLTLRWIKVQELKKNSSFITLTQKYIKPLPSLDIRV